MPAGEIKLAEIGKRMENGEFGHRLQAGQFIDLGSGSVLQFDQVDAVNGDLIGLFLRTEGSIFTASRGRFWQLPSGAKAIELRDGQVIQESDERVLDFSRFQHLVDEVEGVSKKKLKDEFRKRVNIGVLWESGTTSSRSAVYGRFLWAALILPVPLLALILGRPPRRQSGAVGILIGVIFLVAGLKMITPLIDGYSNKPELLAAGIFVTWGLFVAGLIWAEKVFGQGFIDLWASRILQNIRRPNA